MTSPNLLPSRPLDSVATLRMKLIGKLWARSEDVAYATHDPKAYTVVQVYAGGGLTTHRTDSLATYLRIHGGRTTQVLRVLGGFGGVCPCPVCVKQRGYDPANDPSIAEAYILPLISALKAIPHGFFDDEKRGA